MNKLLLPLLIILSMSNLSFAAHGRIGLDETTAPDARRRTPPRAPAHLSPQQTPATKLAARLKKMMGKVPRWPRKNPTSSSGIAAPLDDIATPLEASATPVDGVTAALGENESIVSPFATFDATAGAATAGKTPPRRVTKGPRLARTPDRHPFAAPTPPGSAKKPSPRAMAAPLDTGHFLAGAGTGAGGYSHALDSDLPLPPRVARRSLKRKAQSTAGGASAGAMDGQASDAATSMCLTCGRKIIEKDAANIEIFKLPDGSIEMYHAACQNYHGRGKDNATAVVSPTDCVKALIRRKSRTGSKDTEGITAYGMLSSAPPEDVFVFMAAAIEANNFAVLGEKLMRMLERVRRPDREKLKETIALAVMHNSNGFFEHARHNKHFSQLILEKEIREQAVEANADKVYEAFLPADSGKLNLKVLSRHLKDAIEGEKMGIIDVINNRCPGLLASSNEETDCLSSAINSNKVQVVRHLVTTLHVGVSPYHRTLAGSRGKAMQDALGSAH